jgi:hypothetical protein
MSDKRDNGWIITFIVIIALAIIGLLYSITVYASEGTDNTDEPYGTATEAYTENDLSETLRAELMLLLDEVRTAREETELIREDMKEIFREIQRTNFMLDIMMKFVFLLLVYIVIRAVYRFISGMF